MNVEIVVDYLFDGVVHSLKTDSGKLNLERIDPLDQTTYERQVIEQLIETHYTSEDNVAVSVSSIRALINGDSKPNAYTNAEYAHLFKLEQIIVHIQGYCFPLAA